MGLTAPVPLAEKVFTSGGSWHLVSQLSIVLKWMENIQQRIAAQPDELGNLHWSVEICTAEGLCNSCAPDPWRILSKMRFRVLLYRSFALGRSFMTEKMLENGSGARFRQRRSF